MLTLHHVVFMTRAMELKPSPFRGSVLSLLARPTEPLNPSALAPQPAPRGGGAMLRVYLAAPFLDAPLVRDLDAKLEALGIDVTSTWALAASGPEALGAMPIDEVRRVALANDRDLLGAHLVVALARDGAGAEMFAEVYEDMPWHLREQLQSVEG